MDADLSHPIDPLVIRRIRRNLLRWYDRHRRDLPWRRRQASAYAQWIAEIMLQQTRVDTVIPYFERFMKRFPDPDRLAAARHETVLKHWEGLGYYRRALQLHQAAKDVARGGGAMPTDYDGLRALPGIGDYTAAAIASICYGESVAAVDGNVARVVARLCGVRDDVLTPSGKRAIQGLADGLLAPRRPGDCNQAWMDLGSAVCTPRNPRCEACPLKRDCFAFLNDATDVLPRRQRSTQIKSLTLVTLVCESEGKLLLQRRPRGGLWSGLWEFPTRDWNGNGKEPVGSSGRVSAQAIRSLQTWADELEAIGDSEPAYAGSVRHQLTHRLMTFHVFRVTAADGSIDRVEAVGRSSKRNGSNGAPHRRWVTRAGLDRLSLSTAQRRILALID